MLTDIAKEFRDSAPQAAFWSLRLVHETRQELSVRQDVLRPIVNRTSRGALITVADGGGIGYAATSDLSGFGLTTAFYQAREWAHATADLNLLKPGDLAEATQLGSYLSPVVQAWDAVGLAEKIDWLQGLSKRLKRDEAIVDWLAALAYRTTESLLLTSHGAVIEQSVRSLFPGLRAVAHRDGETQFRSFGVDRGCQGGLEQLERLGYFEAAERVAEEALELLAAPNCPEGRRDLLLLPEQMMLQIHESIGHPLELDRILGDERNYAGTSFVTPEMFGAYQYGSPLLNVSYDPQQPSELASFGYDDEGTQANRMLLIQKGILMRSLGGRTSQQRAGLPGVACTRGCDWNRPPIDRMANLNVEPGEQSLDQLIEQVEDGVLMDANRSWSIDDSRNKFQFGCEYGRRIRNGVLEGLVKNPNYRGISATFWRNLKAVGNRDTFKVMGTPYCGKGEPNQVITVGHAAPACVFADVEIFGGA